MPDAHPLPQTADWLCAECGHPWPCTGARARLLSEYGRGDRVALALYLAALYVEAGAQLQEVPPGILYGRFIGWHRGVAG